MGASDAVPTATVVLPVEPPESVPATLRDLVDTLGPYALGVVAGAEAERTAGSATRSSRASASPWRTSRDVWCC